MNRDEALKLSNDALTDLSLALQQGKSELLVRYLDTMSRFHRYSFGNCMLIMSQKPDATHVAGFYRWRELHRWVRKGEPGIAILAPIVRRKNSRDQDEQRDNSATHSTRLVSGFRVVHVFDISQTEGKELPSLGNTEGDPGERLCRLVQVVRSHDIELEYVDSLDGAIGRSEGGKISVLKGLPPAESFATLVHELAHEMLHQGDRRVNTTKAMRETEAEAVAYVVNRTAGLRGTESSIDYIQLWNGDAAMLLQSLECVRNVSTRIITELETCAIDTTA